MKFSYIVFQLYVHWAAIMEHVSGQENAAVRQAGWEMIAQVVSSCVPSFIPTLRGDKVRM